MNLQSKNKRHILTFTLRSERFAVDAAAVKEIIYLPELTPVEEMPDYIIGVFNFRGHVAPVIDLNIHFGHEQERYRITDRVIVLERRLSHLPSSPSLLKRRDEGELDSGLSPVIFGIIVNDVHDVVAVSERDIEPTLTLRPLPEGEGTAHLIAGEVKFGEEIIMLLNHKTILDFGIEESLKLKAQNSKEQLSALSFQHSASPEELAIFHERAKRLAEPSEGIVPEGQIPLAVLRLNEELYGIDLNVVREFSDVHDVTPVPCTPVHIVGNINLRGEILTLIDIRRMLNITAKKGHQGAKAVVAIVNDLVAGVAVEDVVEVINISPSEIRHVPAAVEAVSHEYIKGEFPYQGKMLSILDVKKILTVKEMVVEG